MKTLDFPEANGTFGPPSDLDETQCRSVRVYTGNVEGGSVDGALVVVVAWQPNDEERALIAEGKPIFISMIGGLAPHFPSMSFQEAIHPS